MTTKYEIVSEVTVQSDIEYFKAKLALTNDALRRDRLIRQIQLLEDSLVAYRIAQGETSLES